MPSTLKDKSGVRIEQKAALPASEYGSLHDLLLRKDMANRGIFFSAFPLTVGAFELPVEGVEFPFGGSESVFKTFNGLLDELGVHGYEVHGRMVRFPPQRSTWQAH